MELTKFNLSKGICKFCKSEAQKEAVNKKRKVIHVCNNCYNEKFYMLPISTKYIYVDYKKERYLIGVNPN